MTTKELIANTFDRLKADCIHNTSISVMGYTVEDMFLESITYILVSDKKLLCYEDLRDFVLKRMRTTKYYRFKTYYSHKTISYDALHKETSQDSES